MPNLSDGTPFITVGNNELAEMPKLEEFVVCWICGKHHMVEYADEVNEDGSKQKSNLLAFFKCGDASYLCGISGKEWRTK